MRTIKQLPVPQDTNVAKFPQGTIQNETDVQQGTPVVREIYGDVLTNIYKLLSLAGITPNGNEDAEDTQYQIIDALKLFSNSTNDIEQILSLNATVWSVPLKLSILPDKYVFIAKAAEDYNSAVVYTFKGSEAAPTIAFSSPTGFKALDEVLIVVDVTGVRAISLTSLVASASETVSTAFGFPIAYNQGEKMYFMSDGSLLANDPFEKDLQTQIRTASGDPLAVIYDTFILNGHVLCLCFLPNTITYQFWQFDLLDLDTAEAVAATGIAFPVGTDNKPFAYSDGDFIYVSNRFGTLADDFEISKLVYDPATPEVSLSSNFALNAAFEKTSNTVVKSGQYIFTFINSILVRYETGTGLRVTIGNYKTINGQIFSFNSSFYYSNGEIGTKWTI